MTARHPFEPFGFNGEIDRRRPKAVARAAQVSTEPDGEPTFAYDAPDSADGD
jgi:hypothetical protein